MDVAAGKAPDADGGLFIREQVREHGQQFDEFTYRIAGRKPTEFDRLLRAPIRDYLMVAEDYMEGIAAQHRAIKNAKAK